MNSYDMPNKCFNQRVRMSTVRAMGIQDTPKKVGRPRSKKVIPAQTRRGRPSDEEIVALAKVAKKRGLVSSLPDGPTDEAGLTLRQRLILQMIKDSTEQRGYPPTIREMGEAVGLASPSSVTHQLKALEAKGFLRRDPKRPRALVVHLPETDSVPVALEEQAPAELASHEN